MPLGIRDVLLLIRARDQASRVLDQVAGSVAGLGATGSLTAGQLKNIGSAMVGVGLGMAAIGGAGVVFFGSATKAAIEYSNVSALTLTQVDQMGVKLEDIKRVGREVASSIAAPFDQMQTSLYDIFSSMDVNVQGAEKLLSAFSKGAVAGQVDVQAAARASISIMNAFKIPVEDVNRVMDVQFETVKKGVLTYAELASTIGRAIPSAVRAGQTVEDLGGMLAFLTRNGLSAAMASTSAARAMDLFSNPVWKTNLEGIGIAVADASGKFRPMVDVVADLRKHFQGMSDVDISAALKDLTYGAGGTIQAMRFLNLAVHDNTNLFGEMTNAVRNSAGAQAAAYDIMAKQPAAQLQLLKNNWEILRTEIGDLFIPVVAKLIGYGAQVLQWFQGLNPHLRDAIIYGAAFLSVFLLIGGIVIAVAGGVLILIAALAPLVGGIGAAVAVVAGLMAALILLPLIGFGVIKNWNDIKRVSSEVWSAVRLDVKQAVDDITRLWDHLVTVGSSAWHTVESDIHWVVNAAENLWDVFQKDLDKLQAFVAHVGDQLQSTWKFIADHTRRWWSEISMIVDFVVKVILAIITTAIDIIAWLWDHGLNHVIGILRGAWDIIFGVVKGAIEIVVSIISLFLDLITGKWSKLGEDLKGIWHGIWDAIQGIVKGAGEILVNAVAGLAGILWQAGRDVVGGLWQGFLSIKDWFTHQFERFLKDIIPGPLRSLFGLSSPSKLMAEYGKNIMQGLVQGITGSASMVQGAMNSAMPGLPGLGGLGVGSKIVYVAPGAIDFSNASITQEALPGLQQLLNQAISRLVQEVNSR